MNRWTVTHLGFDVLVSMRRPEMRDASISPPAKVRGCGIIPSHHAAVL